MLTVKAITGSCVRFVETPKRSENRLYRRCCPGSTITEKLFVSVVILVTLQLKVEVE